VTISKRGKPAAVVVSVEDAALPEEVEGRRRWIRRALAGQGLERIELG
jgi:prevent-host-death family protein